MHTLRACFAMTMAEWKASYQTKAGPEKRDAFEKAYEENVGKGG